ncbi:MAG: CRISPR-associated protein Cas4 [Pseudomonadota bacterium]
MAERDAYDLPLSALQHYLYCPRQCALIHVECQWAESEATAEGRLLHERVDKPRGEKRSGVRLVSALPVRSEILGAFGVCDVVEYREGKPYPVEYKRGKPKAHRADEVQLCAQAICLEEMHGVELSEGAIFYGKTRRRLTVVFDNELRQLTESTARLARSMVLGGVTPPPEYEPSKCGNCSLLQICRPQATTAAASWLDKELKRSLA